MTIHAAMTARPVVEWNDTRYRILLTGSESDGRVGMFEAICQPDGGPPRHLHEREDETFYVIEGELNFWMEGATVSRKPGEMFHIPRGREHTFRVTGPTPARVVVHLTPGGFEGFFPDVAARGLRIPEDLSQVAKLSSQYGMIVTGPPLLAD